MSNPKDYSLLVHQYDYMASDPLSAILDDKNLDRAIARVKANKGKPGVDGMTVNEIKDFLAAHRGEIKDMIRNKKYKPAPVRRVRIPKDNGDGTRPLGIPTAVDRVIQQATGNVLVHIFEEDFSDASFAYREGLGAWDAIDLACEYLDDGYEWIVDLDITKFFDTVNQDKLISLIRTKVNDAAVLHLIRAFLRAGAMDKGVLVPTELGVPQGGPLSSMLSLIYLTPLDNEMEKRGYRYCRYADDIVIFTKSKMAAERVLKSISNWIEKNLFLKVNPLKSKVVTPDKAKYLGFTFLKEKTTGKWVPHPHKSSIQKFRRNLKKATSRRFANSMELGPFIEKLNQKIGGWINYYAICPHLKGFLTKLSGYVRHRVRTWILKHWKNRSTMVKNLMVVRNFILKHNAQCSRKDRIRMHSKVTDEYIYAQCYTRCGWNKLGNNMVVNTILSPRILHSKIFKEGLEKPIALINPLTCYSNRRANIPSYHMF